MADIFDKYSHARPDSKPIIYAYSDTRWPGYLKVGYTARPIEERMKEHYPTLTPTKSYTVECVESALYPDGTNFMDHDVHRVLKKKGFKIIKDPDDKETEWVECSADDVRAAIIAVKTHTLNEENRTATFGLRPEQESAVNITSTYFAEEKAHNPTRTVKFLWNCKMRFGKTFTTYKLAQKMGMKKVLILTFKPAVEESWETDLLTHVDFEGWQFYSRDIHIRDGIEPDDLEQSKPIVCFGSFQDFLGTNAAGGIKAKNEWVHEVNWDMVVFDEYHFGAWRENAKKLFDKEDEDRYDELDIEKYKQEEADNAINESFLPITTDYYLYLSGTPFRSLNNGEFTEDQVFSWTYSDEQREKEKWNDKDGDNPYASLPRMVMMTYKVPDSIQNIAVGGEFNEFDLNVFFSAKSEDGNPKNAQFVYKEYVQKWLDLIRGAYMPTTLDDLKLGQNNKPVMPYSDVRMLNTLTHTLWFLPNVASCNAMANLLAEKQNSFYHDYKVNIAAGSSAGIGLAALEPVRESMEQPLESKTITLSCGKLTTGVTVKPWTGIMMLRGLSSPETYFQAAFRVQSPWTIDNEDGSVEIMKQECYIFDFAINRALRQISEYSCQLDVKEQNPDKKVGDFIHFLPVIAYDGSTMTAVSATDILDLTTAGTSATLLARRWESALLVNVDNATLQKILDTPAALEALNNIEGFRALNKDIETIINKSEAVKKAKKERGDDMTPKERKQLSEEEKEYKSKRKQIQEKLIKFATRIPVFMYLTDFREATLKDVITHLEPSLFKRVTGLTVEDFELLVSLGVFNDTLMNDAVYKFRRYEDASLEYTGIRRHKYSEDVGLFSTTISRDEYEEMAKQQQASMMNAYNIQTNTIVATGLEKQKDSYTNVSTSKEKKNDEIEPRMVAESTLETSRSKEETTEFDVATLKIGMKVEHNKFGEGEIVDIGDKKITVKFMNGEKVLAAFAFDKGFVKPIK